VWVQVPPPAHFMKKNKVLCIVGPTASGKSALAVDIALKIGGEVISADSRQVYRTLDIGTGKITEKEMMGIPHHLLDVADPSERYSVSRWKESAERLVEEISGRGKIPIVCGGTGFYIEALVDNITFPEVISDPDTRKILEEKSSEELMDILREIDPVRAGTVDPKNKRRLARAVEIARALGRVPQVIKKSREGWDISIVGIDMPDSLLRERIHKRLIERLDVGMIDEARRIHDVSNISYERMDELGLEYRYLAQYLKREYSDNPMTSEEFIKILSAKIWQYAKRQRTWFKRDTRIRWYEPGEYGDICKDIERWVNR
jgi:tRNA dimethylallyltransferase